MLYLADGRNFLSGLFSDPLIQGLLKGAREEKKGKRGRLVRADISVKDLIGT